MATYKSRTFNNIQEVMAELVSIYIKDEQEELERQY